MSWRIITIQNEARIILKNKQILICKNGKNEATLPIEDICALFLDSPQIQITTALLSKLQSNNVIVITCDDKHNPNGILMPFHQHSRLSEIAHLQHSWKLPYRKRCWQIIIQQKIKNQAKCLDILGKQSDVLKDLAKLVDSGDKKNIEALAARHYWKNLFSPYFRRKDENIISSSLNYGYAIARSIICRALVGYGLLPCFGIHHNNSLNAFNLADDIIEPFRPIIDLHVHKTLPQFSNEKELTKEMRATLINISILPCLINNQIQVLHNAADLCASSLVKSIRQRDPNLLKLPSLSDE